MKEHCDPGTKREATGYGQTPLGAGQGTRKELAQRNSFPGSTLVAWLKNLLISLVPEDQQLTEQAEKARVPCQEHLASW